MPFDDERRTSENANCPQFMILHRIGSLSTFYASEAFSERARASTAETNGSW